MVDGKTFEVKGAWEKDGKAAQKGYDFWYQPNHDVLVNSEFCTPWAFRDGFDPKHVDEGESNFTHLNWFLRETFK